MTSRPPRPGGMTRPVRSGPARSPRSAPLYPRPLPKNLPPRQSRSVSVGESTRRLPPVRKKSSTLGFYLLLLPLTCILGVWQGWSWWSWAKAPVHSASDSAPALNIQVEIPQGTPTQVIGENLESAGLIHSAAAWKLWSRWLSLRQSMKGDSSGHYQAGVYLLSTNQSLPDIAAAIWNGEVEQSSFTIPEGWSLHQMANYFESQGFFSAPDFLNAATVIPSDRFPWLPYNLPHLEGFLYPETYQLPQDEITPEQVITLMLEQFEQVALPLYQSQGSQFSLQEWVTLASIVEKEAVVPEERSRIAGVLLNRLRIGMNLQVDPTVEYGLGIQQTPDSPLTLAEVQTPSPYNTYLNPGLPPTPIASPSLESLQAVLAPEQHEYLYFVARYDGTHVFSQTLADHEAAQALIRERREQGQ